MGINVDQINPFLMASVKLLKDICLIDTKIGKPFLKDANFDQSSTVIKIDITGQMQGQVMMEMDSDVACEIASKMCMMPIDEMNEISQSAIAELGNMILGNAATIFSTKGIIIDITPPTVSCGGVTYTGVSKNLCIPMNYDNGKLISLNMMISA